MERKRLIVGMSGATGAIYGIRLLEILAERADVETHLVVSRAAGFIICHESTRNVAEVEQLADAVYRVDNLAASIASGSFATAGMVIAPCSMKSLSAVANSYAADLIGRAADVTLKERRPLVLMVRETPFHIGHLHLMTQATEMGATIMPPIPVFYGRPTTIAQLVDETLGRVLSHVGVDNDLYTRWEG